MVTIFFIPFFSCKDGECSFCVILCGSVDLKEGARGLEVAVALLRCIVSPVSDV